MPHEPAGPVDSVPRTGAGWCRWRPAGAAGCFVPPLVRSGRPPSCSVDRINGRSAAAGQPGKNAPRPAQKRRAICPSRAGLGRAGPGWAGLGRAGMGWAGLDWAGPGWAGPGWAGISSVLAWAGLEPDPVRCSLDLAGRQRCAGPRSPHFSSRPPVS